MAHKYWRCMNCGDSGDTNPQLIHVHLGNAYSGPAVLEYSNDKSRFPSDVKSTLEEAEAIITDRMRSYGPPKDHFELVSKLWGPILNRDISPSQVAMCMIALKLARECHRQNRDNKVDMAGYVRILEILES